MSGPALWALFDTRVGNLSPQIHLIRRAIRITFSSTDLSAQNYQHNLFFLAESEFDVCLTQEDLLFPAPIVLSRKAFKSASFQCSRQSSEWGDELQEWDLRWCESSENKILILLCDLKQIVSSSML